MAGARPLEERSSQPAPGAFPETPANEEQQFSVNPIPASEGQGNPVQLAPGEKAPDSSAINSNSVQSGVHDDPELKAKDEESNQTFGVAPIPASGGIGNPIQLAPGEKVPDSSEVTSNTVDSTAKTDQASYEKSDAGITPVQPDPKTDPVAAGLGPQSSSQIPESSMGMGKDAPSDINKEDTGPTISSVAPTSTTNDLAGQVPKEERREATVIDDSKENAKPEAEKSEKSNNKGFMGALAGGAAAAGAAMAGGAYAANEAVKDKTGKDPKSALPESAQKTVDDNAPNSTASVPQQAAQNTADDNALSSTASIPQQTAAGEMPKVPKEETDLKPVSSVPDEVTKSQKEAQFPPEASASNEAVEDKKEVEQELLQKVPESDATGEPAPTTSAAAATTAPAPTSSENATSASGAPQLGDPTAGVAALSMDDKAKSDESAKASEPAKATEGEQKPLDSRDVSPMSRPATTQQTQPEVTTGTSTSKAPTESTPTPRPAKDTANSTPQKRQSFVDRMKGTPSSAKSGETTDSKKEKRRSLFGRIKDKLKN